MALYAAAVSMAGSPSLRSRITAAAAAEGIEDPTTWTNANIWQIVAELTWAQAWRAAEAHADRLNYNPDTGIRSDVITDAMIRTGVQERIAELLPPA